MKLLKWIKSIFIKEDNFDNFLKKLVKERKEAKYKDSGGTIDTGPR